jgi:hypothetical protein
MQDNRQAPQNNLAEQLEWLRVGDESARFAGFSYATKASTDIQKPAIFNFENCGRRANKNSTLATILALRQQSALPPPTRRIAESPQGSHNRNLGNQNDGLSAAVYGNPGVQSRSSFQPGPFTSNSGSSGNNINNAGNITSSMGYGASPTAAARAAGNTGYSVEHKTVPNSGYSGGSGVMSSSSTSTSTSQSLALIANGGWTGGGLPQLSHPCPYPLAPPYPPLRGNMAEAKYQDVSDTQLMEIDFDGERDMR